MRDPEPLVLMRRIPPDLGIADLKQFARALRQKVTGGREFLCLITRDAELRRLNRQFLGKDYATDVLSFPAPVGSRGLGELAISLDRALQQAKAFGHPVEDEIRILMLHGVLHLLGMDHERDRGAMARAEMAWRKRLLLPAGLIERVHP